jgi:hypothetical protein
MNRRIFALVCAITILFQGAGAVAYAADYVPIPNEFASAVVMRPDGKVSLQLQAGRAAHGGEFKQARHGARTMLDKTLELGHGR